MQNNKNRITQLIYAVLLVSGLFAMSAAYKAGWFAFVILFTILIGASIIIIVRTLHNGKLFRFELAEGNNALSPANTPYPEEQKAYSLKRFLLILFATALIIRIIFVVMVHLNSVSNGGEGYFYKYVYNRGNDDEYYHTTGHVIAESWKSGKLLDFKSMFKYRGGVHIAYNVFVGGIYFLCGDNIMFGKLINALLGALIPVYIFFIGFAVFGEKPAKLAAILCAFDSYLIFFGGFLYKDILITFLAVFVIWQFIKFVKTGNNWSLFYAVAAILFEFFTRTYMGAALGVSLFAYFLVFAAPKDRGARIIYFMILMIMSTPFFYLFFRIAKSQLGSKVVRVKSEEGVAEDTGVEDTRVFSPKRLGTNALRIFFSPIPWRNLKDSWENIFYWVYPGKWLWYVFLPFFFVGGYFALKEHFREAFVPAAVVGQYIFILIIIMQTAYRHQAPIMPLMLLTASAGFCRIKHPLAVYLVYLPCLVMFFSFDNDMLKGGAAIMALMIVIFAVHTLATHKQGIKDFLSYLKTQN